jgi:hydroxyacylglutathione hydrolase
MKIKQFRFDHPPFGSVFSYLLWSDKEALVVDGGATDEVLEFCHAMGIKIKQVTNTHCHDDHTGGNSYFIEKTGAQYISPEQAVKQEIIKVGTREVRVTPVPGHSEDSVLLSFDNILITGDTLFTGTIGNCYTNDYESYFKSLEYIMSFPDNTEVYPGHDLMEYATGVAEKFEPDNPHIDEYRKFYKYDCVKTTIGWEKKVNPFVRWDDPALDSFRATLDKPLDTPYERFRAMMSVH